jgi:copper(I)-binding protein
MRIQDRTSCPFAGRFLRWALAACCLALWSGAPAAASDATPAASAGIAVTAAWARATAPGIATGAVYLTIANGGDDAVGLLSATCPVAATVALHRHVMTPDGAMRMEQVGSLDIPAHGAVTCAPGGYHLMLFGLTRPLVAGTTVPVTLVFAGHGAVTVPAAVGGIAAMGPEEAGAPTGAATTAAGSATGASATACGCGP